MADFQVKQGGTFKTVNEFQAKQGGTWKPVVQAWAKEGGSWKQFWPLFEVDLSGIPSAIEDSGSGTGIRTDYEIYSIGTHRADDQAGDRQLVPDWLVVGTGAELEVRLTKNSGDTPTGSAINTWLPLSADYAWKYQPSASTTLNGSFTLEIRVAVSGFVIGTDTFSMLALRF